MLKKVSIITPCYNGEDFISRFLESVLKQTYQNIELILINDGSADRTEEIVISYSYEFKKAGIDLVYIYQKNEGQASALNKGLKLFKGDYITWPDSDDILSTDSIEKKVNFLEKYSEYALVRSDANKVYENDMENVVGNFAKRGFSKEYIFLDLITEETYICCGCYMVRASTFLNVNMEREIYHATRAGQNWQMLLPLTYNNKCGFIDEKLYTYVIRENSHSHSIKSVNNILERCDAHEDVLLNSINRISMSQEEKQKYRKVIEEKYARKRFNLAIELNNCSIYEKEYKLLSKNNKVKNSDKIKYILAKNNLFFIYTSFKNIIKKLKNTMLQP